MQKFLFLVIFLIILYNEFNVCKEVVNLKLNTSAEIPLYLQLKEAIKAAIKDETFLSNQKIPTEIELSQQYNVSRITVRRAVEELCQEDYLIKRQGKGTFVKQKKVQRKMEYLLSFSEACKANGRVPSRLVIQRQVITLSEEDAIAMNQPIGSKAIMIDRVNLADGIPLIYEKNIFPYHKYAFLLEETLDGSLYQLLEEKYQIKIKHSLNSYLEVTRATGEIAKLLQVSNGEPLFYLYSEMRDSKNELAHISKEYILAEQYRFYLDDYTKD